MNAGDRASRDFLAYGFFHTEVFAFALSLLFFLVAGIGLEGAWGSLAFLALCVAGLFGPALVHATWAGEGGIPFSGASGLLAALLTAYGLRGWGGRLAVPGWILLPLWFFAEYFIVRQVWLDSADGLPWMAHAAGFGVGALAAGAVVVLGLEARFARRADLARSAANPVLALAARAVAEGQLEAAWSALSNAAAENPQDNEVARAWWSLACDQGRAGEAVHVILPRIVEELRGGDREMAIADWFEIMHHAPESEVEARITTRLAEALIDRGDSAAAREALRRAVEDSQGLNTALAQRVVRSAREIDPELARAAARVALQDAQLDPDSRESLEALAGEGESPTGVVVEEVVGAPDASPASGAVADLDDGPGVDEAVAVRAEPEELVLEEQAGSLGETDLPEEEFEDEALEELGLAEDEELTPAEDADDWPREPGPIGLSEIDPAALSIAGLEDEAELDEDPDPDPDEEYGGPGLESLEPLEMDSVLDAAASEHEGEDADSGAYSALNLLEESLRGESELAASEFELEKEEALVDAQEDDAILEMSEELLLEDEPEIRLPLRGAKILEAVPVGIGAEALEVEIQGRGRGRIPYERIEALAVAAVSGLSARPVLVVDLILNWKAEPSESFKLIRMRANRFDPLTLSPRAGSPLQALKNTVATLSERSGATCLPDPEAVSGSPFVRFESLAEYEVDVLGVESQPDRPN